MRFFLLLLFLSPVVSGSSQTITFDMFVFGDKIGTMTITRTLKADSSEHYLMESKSEATILWIRRRSQTRYEVVYKNGKLQLSSIKEVENDKVTNLTKVTYANNKYDVECNGTKKSFTQSPVASIVTLFFKMPVGQKTVFYETLGEFYPLQNPETNTYQFKSADGHNNVYHYVDGKIHHLEFHVSIATVKLVRAGG